MTTLAFGNTVLWVIPRITRAGDPSLFNEQFPRVMHITTTRDDVR